MKQKKLFYNRIVDVFCPITLMVLIAATTILLVALSGAAAEKETNILVIWGDDFGQSNISAYNRGLVGYKTPNIDRLAKAGIIFTDCCGQQSCTASFRLDKVMEKMTPPTK